MPVISPRLLVPTPNAGDANDIPAVLLAMANALEARAAGLLSGTFAARPAAAAANARFLYWATDGRAWFTSDGAAWQPLAGVQPMTTAQRDALVAGSLWDGRLIANTTTDRIERWDAGAVAWKPSANDNVTYGVYAAMPAASPATEGTFYFATDASAWFASLASIWFPLGEIEPMTTVNRNNLIAAGKWDGRVIYNTNTLQLELYSAASASWVPAGGSGPSLYSRFLGGN